MEGESKYNSNEWRANRRINYMLIRKIWDAINGGLGHCGVRGFENERTSLTGMFETSKYKWDGMISGDIHIHSSEAQPKRLEKKTGIPQKVFTGEERIVLMDDEYNQALERQYVKEDSSSAWKKEYKAIKRRMFQSFKNMEPDYDKNRTLYLIWHFIKYKEPFVVSVKSGSEFKQLSMTLNRIQIKHMDRTAIDELKKYREALRRQYDLVSAVIIYRTEKELDILG